MYQTIIIEDDPIVASINHHFVELNKDMEVCGCFSNGQDALNYLEEHSVDLAITELYMPKMDGMELLREIRRQEKDLDVIVVSSANDVKHVKKFLSLGIIDYLIKPFEYTRFNHALEKFTKSQELLKPRNFSQSQLDKLFYISSLPLAEENSKGIQEATLSSIMDYMKMHQLDPMTSDMIAKEVRLSSVTVRRYMNYLLEKQRVISDIDYNTGGRPSVVYRYIIEEECLAE